MKLRDVVNSTTMHNFLAIAILGDFSSRLGQSDARYTFHEHLAPSAKTKSVWCDWRAFVNDRERQNKCTMVLEINEESPAEACQRFIQASNKAMKSHAPVLQRKKRPEHNKHPDVKAREAVNDAYEDLPVNNAKAYRDLVEQEIPENVHRAHGTQKYLSIICLESSRPVPDK